MATAQPHGIANGHWERSEPRSAWLLMLARMGVAELHMLGETVRGATRRQSREQANDIERQQESGAVAAE